MQHIADVKLIEPNILLLDKSAYFPSWSWSPDKQRGRKKNIVYVSSCSKNFSLQYKSHPLYRDIYLLFILLYILILQGFYNLGVCLPPVINWLLFIRLNYDLSYCHSTIFAIKPSGLTDPSAKWESCSWQAFIIHTRSKTAITSEIKIIEAQTRRTYLFNGLQCSMMISEKASLTIWHSTRFSIPG